MSNILAELLLRERLVLSQRAFVEIVIWRLPAASRGSEHDFKYRLAYVASGRCVLRFDNEAGKGDHMHVEEVEVPHTFTDLEALQTGTSGERSAGEGEASEHRDDRSVLDEGRSAANC